MLVIGPSDLANLMALLGLMAACAGAAGALCVWLAYGLVTAFLDWLSGTAIGMEWEDKLYVRAMNAKTRAQGGAVHFLLLVAGACAVAGFALLSGCSSEPLRILQSRELSAHDQWIEAVKRGAW